MGFFLRLVVKRENAFTKTVCTRIVLPPEKDAEVWSLLNRGHCLDHCVLLSEGIGFRVVFSCLVTVFLLISKI